MHIHPVNPFLPPSHVAPSRAATVAPAADFASFALDCFDWAPILPHDQGAYTVRSLSGTGERYVLTPKRGPANTCLCTCPSHARLRAKAAKTHTTAPECKHAALAALAPAFIARLRDLWAKGHAPDSARALWDKRLALYTGDLQARTLAALQALHDARR